MAVIRWHAQARAHYSRNHMSGGKLNVPRTPVERIMLYAKLKSLKRDFVSRHGS